MSRVNKLDPYRIVKYYCKMSSEEWSVYSKNYYNRMIPLTFAERTEITPVRILGFEEYTRSYNPNLGRSSKSPLHLPLHNKARNGEKRNRNRNPNKQNRKIKSNPRMGPKQNSPHSLDNYSKG